MLDAPTFPPPPRSGQEQRGGGLHRTPPAAAPRSPRRRSPPGHSHGEQHAVHQGAPASREGCLRGPIPVDSWGCWSARSRARLVAACPRRMHCLTAPVILFLPLPQGIDEPTIPEVKLTRSRDGASGTGAPCRPLPGVAAARVEACTQAGRAVQAFPERHSPAAHPPLPTCCPASLSPFAIATTCVPRSTLVFHNPAILVLSTSRVASRGYPPPAAAAQPPLCSRTPPFSRQAASWATSPAST